MIAGQHCSSACQHAAQLLLVSFMAMRCFPGTHAILSGRSVLLVLWCIVGAQGLREMMRQAQTCLTR